jgi:hypothetical protein
LKIDKKKEKKMDRRRKSTDGHWRTKLRYYVCRCALPMPESICIAERHSANRHIADPYVVPAWHPRQALGCWFS